MSNPNKMNNDDEVREHASERPKHNWSQRRCPCGPCIACNCYPTGLAAFIDLKLFQGALEPPDDNPDDESSNDLTEMQQSGVYLS